MNVVVHQLLKLRYREGLVLDVAALGLALGLRDHRLVIEVGIIRALGDAWGQH